jgi:hypothetical protein
MWYLLSKTATLPEESIRKQAASGTMFESSTLLKTNQLL